jgi:hypothetical protein
MARCYLLWLTFSSELRDKDPGYPMVKELDEKSDLFDSLVSKYNVPPLASA